MEYPPTTLSHSHCDPHCDANSCSFWCAQSRTERTPHCLGTVTLANALSCSEECAVSPDVVGAGDTCLFVTLMDQFGDG